MKCLVYNLSLNYLKYTTPMEFLNQSVILIPINISLLTES